MNEQIIEIIIFSISLFSFCFVGIYFFRMLLILYKDTPREVLPLTWLYIYLVNFFSLIVIVVSAICIICFFTTFAIENKEVLGKLFPLPFGITFYFSGKFLLKISTVAVDYEKEKKHINQKQKIFWERMELLMISSVFEGKLILLGMIICEICLIALM